MCAAPDPDDRDAVDLDVVDLDTDDAFGHPALVDPARDAVWSDGDEDDIDV